MLTITQKTVSIVSISIFMATTAVSGLVLAAYPSPAAYINTHDCPNAQALYAQDVEGYTPGSGQHQQYDTAVINDRSGNHQVVVPQHDHHVVWPATYLVRVLTGERLFYHGHGDHPYVVFDILGNNQHFIQKIVYGSGDTLFTMPRDGFLRFNAGDTAFEYTILVLCPPVTTQITPLPQPIPVVVQTVNHSPIWNQMPNQTVATGQNLNFTVLAIDPDNDFLTYTALNLPAGAFFNPYFRSFSWTPNYNQASGYIVTFRVSDGHNAPVDMNVVITVTQSNPNPNPTSTNHPPVWNPTPAQSVTSGQVLQFTVSATDSDGDYLTYTATNLPAGAFFDPYFHSLTWTPTYNQAGSYTVNFRVSDGHNVPVDMSVTIIVNQGQPPYIYQPPVYQPPVYQPPIQYQYQYQYEFPYVYSIFHPIQSPYQNQYQYSNYNTYQYPYYNNYQNYGYGNYGYNSYYNRPPVWNQTPSQTIFVGQTLQLSVSAYDQDGDPLAYSVLTLPSGAHFDATYRNFSWTPNASQVGVSNIIFQVSDGHNPLVQMTVLVTVNGSYNYVCPGTYGPLGCGDYPPANESVSQPAVERLKVTNLYIQPQANGDSYVYWTTNKAASSRVIYDTVTHPDRSDKNYNYANATPEDAQLVTSHSINLGQLTSNQTYYLRAVSKLNSELAVSDELIFTKSCPSNVSYAAGFSGLGVFLSGLLISPWLLLLIIIILLVFLVRAYRRA